jgi:hypothetical protein
MPPADPAPFSDPVPPAALPRRRPIAIDTAPGPAGARAIADALGLLALEHPRLAGTLRPEGVADWRLDARLTGTATQACVVSLAPVVTRIDAPVTRRFVVDWSDPGPGERRMEPDDDTAEPLGRAIDPGAILVEELSLALPDHPRAPGARFEDPAPDPGRQRPFAGLDRRLDDDG